MNRVLDKLWIGSEVDLTDATPLASLGFSGVVDLRDGDRAPIPGVVVLRLRNRDGDPWSEKEVSAAVDFIGVHVREGGRVLVACAAGKSRSVCMVVAYLVATGWDAPSAFALVKEARKEVAPAQKMLDGALAVVGCKG